MEFIIYRDSWRRGGDEPRLREKFGSTSLFDNEHKMMCCLGQCSVQLGAKLGDIQEIGEPADVSNHGALDGVLLAEDEGQWRQTSLARQAMSINDEHALPDYLREKRLAELFSRHGFGLKFINGVAPYLNEQKR